MQDPSKSGWAIDAGDAEFQADVLDRSREVPVVVDFWAEWCGPCRMLGPILEKLARDMGGAFVLVKVNVDEAQQLAAYFRIEGIPAVRVFRNGELVDGFDGLYPEEAVREMLERHLPTDLDRTLQEAAGLESTDAAAAEKLYRQVLAGDGDNPRARLGLARLLVAAHKDEEAKQMLAPLGVVDEIGQEAERLRRVLELRGGSGQGAGFEAETDLRRRVEADPENARLRLELGSLLAQQERYPEALESLLAAAERDRELARNEVRELMVKIFQIIGVRSELSDDYRARLQSLLY